MNRRDFMKLAAAALAAGTTACERPPLPSPLYPAGGASPFEQFFLKILSGYLTNTCKTSLSFAVCNFPNGTHLKTCDNPNGNTYVSVARMLPPMVAWMQSGRSPQKFDVGNGRLMSMRDVLLATYRNAFDPTHMDFWGMPVNVNGKPTQRSVESSLVALSLSRLGEAFVKELTPQQRKNIQNWLAACTVVPERTNNHAWFTAVNQAARLKLSRRFKEFSGDSEWMEADLAALDALYKTGKDGWYSDSPDAPVFDYYAFWTFGNFPLYWAEITGDQYPKWASIFRERVKAFLVKTPYFYAANGAHPLYGRSLIYRWSMLSPMVEGYRQGLWPHSAGLLRRICRLSIDWERQTGAFDETRGKLRELYTDDGSPFMREPYIDNGHPYWTMQGYSFLSIPRKDPFWTDKEEPLPIETNDFVTSFAGPRFMLVGSKRSGQVKWIHSQTVARRQPYRDKYIKFGYSSHFFFNVIKEDDRVPWDQTLVLRDKTGGACYGRSGITSGELTGDGCRTNWFITMADKKIEILTQILVGGEFERRTHEISMPDGLDAANFEALEGSYALGLSESDLFTHETQADGRWQSITGPTGQIISWNLGGFGVMEVTQSFGQIEPRVNAVYPKFAINTLRGPLKAGVTKLSSGHYASPKAQPREAIFQEAAEQGIIS